MPIPWKTVEYSTHSHYHNIEKEKEKKKVNTKYFPNSSTNSSEFLKKVILRVSIVLAKLLW